YRKVVRAAPDQLDVLDSPFSRRPLSLAEHVRLGVNPDGLLEERRKLQQEDAGSAAKIEQPTVASTAESGEASNQIGGIPATVPGVEARAIPPERPILLPTLFVCAHHQNLDTSRSVVIPEHAPSRASGNLDSSSALRRNASVCHPSLKAGGRRTGVRRSDLERCADRCALTERLVTDVVGLAGDESRGHGRREAKADEVLINRVLHDSDGPARVTRVERRNRDQRCVAADRVELHADPV